MYGTLWLSVKGFAYFRTRYRDGVRNPFGFGHRIAVASPFKGLKTDSWLKSSLSVFYFPFSKRAPYPADIKKPALAGFRGSI